MSRSALAALALTLPLAAAGQARLLDVQRGLSASYPLDGDAVDEVTGTRAAPVATRPVDGRDGRRGGALFFDGQRSAVNLGDALQPQRFTISAFVRPEALDRVQAIVSKIRNLPGDYQKNLELRLDPGGRVFLHVPSGAGWEGVASQRTIPAGRWTHVAAVYDGARAQLYVDGVRDGAPLQTAYAQSRTPTFVGARPEGGGRDARSPAGPTFFFFGAIDDVRVWDRPLSDAELAVVSGRVPPLPEVAPAPPPRGPPAPPAPGRPPAAAELLAQYPFDGDARDAAGRADGTSQGARPAEDRQGDAQGALAFAGRELVDLGVRTEPERFSLAAWIRPARLDRDLVVFSKYSSAPGPRDRWLELRVEAGGKVALAVPGGGARGQGVRSSRALAIGRWVHLAATFDGERAVLYVDGDADAEASLQPFEASRGPVFIGARPEANGKRGRLSTFFEGRIDDLRLYRGALDAREVAGLARGGERPRPGEVEGDDDTQPESILLVKVDHLLARFDGAAARRDPRVLAKVEALVLRELEDAERGARGDRDLVARLRRASAELQALRGRVDAMSLDRKRASLFGLSEALWNDLAQSLDDRTGGVDVRRDDAWK